MAVDERSRHELYLKLEETLGPDAATTLMEHLPGVGWADVATKHDLDAFRVATRQDLDVLRRELTAMITGETGSIRGELDVLRRELTTELGAVEERVTLRFEATLHRELARQSRSMIFAMIGVMLTMGSLTLTAIHLA